MRVITKILVGIFCALRLIVPAVSHAQVGLLVVAHGAGAEWNAPVRQTVAAVRWDGPVALAFLMGEERVTSGWDSAVVRLVREGAQRIVVVPMMVSSFGEHVDQLRWLTGELDHLPAVLMQHAHGTRQLPPVPMQMTPALDDAPELAEAIAIRWNALLPQDRRRAAVLIAHGPNEDAAAAKWVTNLLPVSAGLEAAGVPAVRIALLRDDAPPEVRARAIGALRDTTRRLAAMTGDSVVVLPVLISSGSITATTIPRDLEGLPVRYVRLPLAPLAPLSRWIERVGRATPPRPTPAPRAP